MFVADLGGRLNALNSATGATLWTFLDDALTGDHAWTSPAVANGIVYVGVNRPGAQVYAANAVTGAQVWTTAQRVSNIVSSPAVVGGVVYVAFTDHAVLALNATTGATIWSADAGAGMYSSPAVVGGRVYIAVHNRGLLALDAATGKQQWLAAMPGPQWSSPAVVGGRVIVGSRDDQRVYAFDAATGQTLFSSFVGDGDQSGDGEWVVASPTIANGVIYIGSYEGQDSVVTAFGLGGG